MYTQGFIKHIVIILVALFVLSAIGFNVIDIFQSSGVEGQAEGFFKEAFNFFMSISDPVRGWILELIHVIKEIV